MGLFNEVIFVLWLAKASFASHDFYVNNELRVKKKMVSWGSYKILIYSLDGGVNENVVRLMVWTSEMFIARCFSRAYLEQRSPN